MTEFHEKFDFLEVAHPKQSGKVVRLDLREVHTAESRVGEVAFITPSKSPELMACFSRACFTLGRYLATLTYCKEMATKHAKDRRAIVVIDVVPDTIKEKKVASNEDNRSALVEMDPSYSALVETRIETEAALVYVERKLRDMEGALNAVKKLVGETSGVFYRPNPNLSTGGMDQVLDKVYSRPEPQPEPSKAPAEQKQTKNGTLTIGKARFD